MLTFDTLKDTVVDKWLTWRTGYPKHKRERIQWYIENVDLKAYNISDMFRKFKHVFEVDPDKFFDRNEPFAWIPAPQAEQYFWPHRPLNNTAVWKWERVTWDIQTKQYIINGMFGNDKLFIATNNDNDATMMMLKFG